MTDSVKLFGDILRTFYKKDDSYRKTDFTINYLGLVSYCKTHSTLHLSIIANELYTCTCTMNIHL